MRRTGRLALVAGAAAMLASAALAAPIALMPPLSKDGKQFYAVTHKKQQPCPEAAVVGVPAYPGSLCLGVIKVEGDNAPPSKRLYPKVVLVSAAPPAKVSAWYKTHLPKSWSHNSKATHFTPPGWSMARIGHEASLYLEPVDKMHPVFGAAFFKTGPIKTAITIYYKPQG